MAILGAITWFMVTFMGYGPISIAYDRADEREIFNYGLTFSKTIQYGFQTIRYSGFFDEPGAMGYWVYLPSCLTNCLLRASAWSGSSSYLLASLFQWVSICNCWYIL